MHDQELVRWGLHELQSAFLFGPSNDSSGTSFIPEPAEPSTAEDRNSEPLVHSDPPEHSNLANDEAIAHVLQEELSKLEAEDSQSTHPDAKVAVLNQDWSRNGPSNSADDLSHGWMANGRAGERPSHAETAGDEIDALATAFQSHVAVGGQNMSPPKQSDISKLRESPLNATAPEYGSSSGTGRTPDSINYDSYQYGDDEENLNRALALSESEYSDEVARRLTPLDSIKHVPRTNAETLPTQDDATLDHARLAERLILYGLSERHIQGDGNCQFRALSDQIYRSSEHHGHVRKGIVSELKSRPDVYSGYVPMAYSEYLKKMAKNGEWGDHVTLQAAADHYGVKIWLITSFKDTSFIEILPQRLLSSRVIHLSFWAEVHYNSIYLDGGEDLESSCAIHTYNFALDDDASGK